MNEFSEHKQDDHPVKLKDTITGALYDDTGLAFIVFLTRLSLLARDFDYLAGGG